MAKIKWKEPTITLGELALVGILRSTAGMGLGMLIAGSMEKKQRLKWGAGLFVGSLAIGVPIGLRLARKFIEEQPPALEESNE